MDRTPGLEVEENGAVKIYIQNEEPTDPKQKANWLPAPAEPFYMVLREYSPQPDILTREWVPAAVSKAN